MSTEMNTIQSALTANGAQLAEKKGQVDELSAELCTYKNAFMLLMQELVQNQPPGINTSSCC